MLYSLVALGFVLIFNPPACSISRRGAMVLLPALAMARFAEWVPPGPASPTRWWPTCWPSCWPAR